MNKSDLARNYRKKFPDYPTLKLARIIYDENKLLFKNEEDARSRLRYIEGKSGKTHRKSVQNTSFVIEEPRPYNP